jgi:uncharacterized membrane protein SpoIIM required for sporulation
VREVAFVKQNADNWKRFEEILQSKDIHNPDEIVTSYIQVIDDLSFARTYYPTSVTYKYLNELSAKVHQSIYKNKKENKSRIITFWKTELPALFYHSRKEFFISFLVFIIAASIGVVSAANDDTFIRLILGDGYVNETLENIKSGHPLAIYSSMPPLVAFILIALNNIKVALSTFASGILLSVGSIIMIFYNGVMVGSFQYFFFQYGALQESLLTIWLHGTIEISVIIIAGCAGIVMGNSILFPATYSRLQSFKKGANHGLKIVIGTVPFFIIAAFIEGFITRYSRASRIFDVLLIFLSLTLITGYFLVYPAILNKKKIN